MTLGMALVHRPTDAKRERGQTLLTEVSDVTHSFRKTVATLIDDAGMSARVGADQLGHTKVSMTRDNYMARNRVHTEVAELLDRVISDE